MKPEAFTEHLQTTLGRRLKAVVLYGSAASDDYIPGKSDYNLLVVCEQWTTRELDAVRAPTAKWTAAGNPPPLCFTPERLFNATDVFPMEMLDILENHRVLHGEDPLAGIAVDKSHLRHQVEFELRSKLLKLRQAYLALARPEKELPRLLDDSLSTFQAVFRGALRLFTDEAPANKPDAVRRLARRLDLDLSVFEELHALKSGKPSAGGNTVERFDRYLAAIETVLDRIDAKSA
ncbi:MAG: hypothetical protein ACLFVC_00390 [Opitutales bacterium]